MVVRRRTRSRSANTRPRCCAPQEIVANAAKVQTALKLSQEDQNTIASLKKEIEKAWKMVDASHEKEQRAKETIQQLKLEITNLSRLVEQGAGLTLGQENTVNELSKQKEELTAERDNLTQQLVSARNEIVDLQDRTRSLDTEKQAHLADIETLKEQIGKSKSDVERELYNCWAKMDATAREPYMEQAAAFDDFVASRKKNETLGADSMASPPSASPVGDAIELQGPDAGPI